MTFETKFSIGDTVWTLHQNAVTPGEVWKIDLSCTPFSQGSPNLLTMKITYHLLHKGRNNGMAFPEHKTFSSKQELIASL